MRNLNANEILFVAGGDGQPIDCTNDTEHWECAKTTIDFLFLRIEANLGQLVNLIVEGYVNAQEAVTDFMEWIDNTLDGLEATFEEKQYLQQTILDIFSNIGTAAVELPPQPVDYNDSFYGVAPPCY